MVVSPLTHINCSPCCQLYLHLFETARIHPSDMSPDSESRLSIARLGNYALYRGRHRLHPAPLLFSSATGSPP